MSGVNIARNIGNQMGEYLDASAPGREPPPQRTASLGRGAGEMRLEATAKGAAGPAGGVAAEVVNEILESALDIATLGDSAAIAFCADGAVCAAAAAASFPSRPASRSPPEVDCEEEGAGRGPQIRVPDDGADQPRRLDAEMKRLLDEMMSPPYDVVAYGTAAAAAPRKDGVGDQPPVDDAKDDRAAEEEEEEEDRLRQVVGKKTRVTDLVMNSKQVLTELLMSEEARGRQADWEERSEAVLQVIELDRVKPEEEEEEGEGFKFGRRPKEKRDVAFAPVARDECLISVDLTKGGREGKKTTGRRAEDCPGDDGAGFAESSYSRGSGEIGKERFRNRFEFLRKKWNINFKFFSFGKRKQKAGEEKAKL